MIESIIILTLYLSIILLMSILMQTVIENMLSSIIISWVTWMSLISIFSICLSFFNKALSNFIIVAISIIIILFLVFLLRKNKVGLKFQPINTKDIFVMIVSTVMTFFVFIKRYGFDFNIKFETTDPAVHYIFADYFSKTGLLLPKLNELIPYAHMSDYPFYSYVNNGILMNLFNIIFTNAQIYIIWNMIIYFVTIIMLYKIVERFVPNLSYKMITLILLLVGFGYNLNDVIFGFSSQMAGMLLVLSIIYICSYTYNNLSKFIIIVTFIGLFYSYYYFVPVAWAAIIFFNSYSYKKSGHSIIKSILNTFNIAITLSLAIFGSLYLFILVDERGSTALASEGYIYRDLFNSILLLIPLIAFYFIKKVNSRKLNIFDFFFVGYISFSVILFGLGMFGKVSSYYFYKNHYLLATLSLIAFSIGLFELSKLNSVIYRSYFLSVILAFVFYLIIDPYIKVENLLFNPPSNSIIESVYGFNQNKLNEERAILSREQQEFIAFISENKESYVGDKNHISVIGNTLQLLWFYSLTEIWPKDSSQVLSELYNEEIINYENWVNDLEKNPYLIIFGEDNRNWFIENGGNLNDFTVIYSKNDAELLKYKY